MKQKPISSLKKELWSAFASWVKKKGRGRCFTCDRTRLSGKKYHAGHFIKASVCGLALYFNPDNVKPQCAYCNIFLDGNQYEFGRRLGTEKVAELYELRQASKNLQWTRKDYEAKIAYYKHLVPTGK
jgi:hypothetical protein